MADVETRDGFTFFWRGWPGQWFRSYFKDKDGNEYTHAEQYMMAQKAKLFGDEETFRKIMKAEKPSEQKALGREVRNFNEKVWRENRDRIVYQANVLKFMQNPKLKELLMATGDTILVEASPVDKIWGIGLHMDDERRSYRFGVRRVGDAPGPRRRREGRPGPGRGRAAARRVARREVRHR